VPSGRFVSRKIALNRQLAGVTLLADHLFTKCIPHLDVEGRMEGHPDQVKVIAVPFRDEIDPGIIPELLVELVEAELVHWYEVEGKAFLEFPGFHRSQPGLRKNREAPSRIPPASDPAAVRMSGADPAQLSLAVEGVPPRGHRRALRISSGVTPAEVPVKEREGKGSEGKERPSTNVLGAAPRVDNDRAVTTSPADLTDGQLMGLVRTHLYVPDGKPPEGENGGRCVTVIQALRKMGQRGYDIAAAIEGLALLRERGELDWLPQGMKCTMRALYNTRTGVRPVMMLAQETYHKHGARRLGEQKSGGMQSIHDVLKDLASG